MASPCRSILIVDPSAEEESLSTARLTVVTDEGDRLCAVHKPGQSKSAAGARNVVSVLMPQQKDKSRDVHRRDFKSLKKDSVVF